MILEDDTDSKIAGCVVGGNDLELCPIREEGLNLDVYYLRSLVG
jgi:hypothetical protein